MNLCRLHKINCENCILQNLVSNYFFLISESIRPGGRPENAAQPRSIADYDYTLKSIPDYDASDYIDGDFDRVQGTPSQQRTTKIQLIPSSNFDDKKKETTTSRSRTSSSSSSSSSSQKSESSFNLSDFLEATPSGQPPPFELSRITPSRGSATTSSQFEHTTSSAAPLSVLDR